MVTGLWENIYAHTSIAEKLRRLIKQTCT